MKLRDHIDRRVKLQDLRILMAITQTGSMNKAAAALHTSQPAVSRSMTELEILLGVRLLDRHPHGVEPTEYGRALLDCGVAIFDDLRQGLKNIAFLADPSAGEVRIGCNYYLAASFVSAVVDRLSRRHPRIVYHVEPMQTEALCPTLMERSVDFLIASRLGSVADGRLHFEALYEESYVVAAGKQNSWTRRRRVELAELANEPWALPPPDSAIGAVVAEAFRASAVDYPPVTMFAITPEARIGLLTTGRFLTVVPASALRFPTRRSDIKILPVALPAARAPVGIVNLKGRTLSPVARLFIEHSRKIAKPLANGER